MYVLALMAVLASQASILASDHIDGVPTSEDPQTDLTDLYAFPAPGGGRIATVILDVYPGVGPKGHFSDEVDYRVFVRRVNVEPGSRSLFSTVESSQLTVLCSFGVPHHHEASRGSDSVSCKLESPVAGDTLAGPVAQVVALEGSGSTRLYAGRRLDPFFLAIKSFQGVRKRKKFTPSDTTKSQRHNGLDTATVLTVALEVDLERYFGEGQGSGLFAIAAESVRRPDGKVIDRVGRAEMVNLSLHRYRKDRVAVKQYYNQEIETFTAATAVPSVVRERLRENVSAYDLLAGGQDWESGELDRFLDVLVEDFLVLDVGAPCPVGENEYFAIERAYLSGAERHDTCGGRKLTDNVMSTIYGLYLGGLASDPKDFRDGVVEPPTIDATFPYLTAAPAKMKLKTRVVLKVLTSAQDGKRTWPVNAPEDRASARANHQ